MDLPLNTLFDLVLRSCAAALASDVIFRRGPGPKIGAGSGPAPGPMGPMDLIGPSDPVDAMGLLGPIGPHRPMGPLGPMGPRGPLGPVGPSQFWARARGPPAQPEGLIN